MSDLLTIGIDLGGTNIKGILVNEQGSILEESTIETKDDIGIEGGIIWKERIFTMVESFHEKSNPKANLIGFSAPGLANPENTCIAFMPERLNGLENFNFGKFLGVETYVLNDAQAHLIAESRYGVAKGYRNVLLLTLGTGVGGAVLIEGNLYQGEIGRAGHFGHISLTPSENQGITGTPGSLEDSIGESTLEVRSHGKYKSTKELVEAYKNGNTLAKKVWIDSVESLARGMISLINAFSPQLFILSGGITESGDALLNPLKNLIEKYEWRPGGFTTEIKIASTGRYTGAMGAATFAMIHKKQKSTS